MDHDPTSTDTEISRLKELVAQQQRIIQGLQRQLTLHSSEKTPTDQEWVENMDFADQFFDTTIVYGPNTPLLDEWAEAGVDDAKLVSLLFTNGVENPAQAKEMNIQQFSDMPGIGSRHLELLEAWINKE